MDEMKVNAFIASQLPPSGTAELAGYVRDAVKALGGRSDAALARTIGVSASTLASWKSRGAVPQDYVTWFSSTLADKIFGYNADLPQVGMTARAAVVELIARTGEVRQSGALPDQKTAHMLGGLLALAEFVASRAKIDLKAADPKAVSNVADTLEGALALLDPASR